MNTKLRTATRNPWLTLSRASAPRVTGRLFVALWLRAFLASVVVIAALSSAHAARVGVRSQVELTVVNNGGYIEARTVYASGSPDMTYSAQGPIELNTGLQSTSYENSEGRGEANAAARFGVLRAFASGRAGGDSSFGYSGNGSGVSMFEDTWTLGKPGLDGQQGTITFQMSVHGKVVGPFHHPGVSPGAIWSLVMDEDFEHAAGSWDYSLSQGVASASPTFTKSFIYGQPFSIRFTLSVSSGATTSAPDSTADYSGTITLDGMWATSNASLVTNATLLTESSHDYAFKRTAPPAAPVLSAFRMLSPETCRFTVAAETNLFYRVQSSADLTAWTDHLSVEATNEIFTVEAPAPPGSAHRFYRVVFQ